MLIQGAKEDKLTSDFSNDNIKAIKELHGVNQRDLIMGTQFFLAVVHFN